MFGGEGFGLVGLRVKGALACGSFNVSRNWLAVGRGVSLGSARSKHQKMSKIKNMINTVGQGP